MTTAENDLREPAFPLVEVGGEPRERGRSHGQQAADRVAKAAELYRGSLSRLRLRSGLVRDLADEFLAVVEGFDAEQAEEIRGIAEGAGLPVEDIVVINARRELVTMAERQQGASTDVDELCSGECTSAVILPEASEDGRVLHGQNWDITPAHSEHAIVLRVRRDDGPDILCFTEAGQQARSGLNEAGIAITANHLACDRDYRDIGVPLPVIRRAALSTPHYALAVSAVYSTRKSGSNNMMLSHKDGEAINIECAPDESFLQHPVEGVLTHANHWETIPALCKLRDPGLAATPCSTFRGDRASRLLRRHLPAIGYREFQGMFLDDFDSPYAICRPPRPSAVGDTMSATAATVIYDPAAGTLDAARLPALDPTFTRYRLSGGTPETLTPIPAAATSE